MTNIECRAGPRTGDRMSLLTMQEAIFRRHSEPAWSAGRTSQAVGKLGVEARQMCINRHYCDQVNCLLRSSA